ncbi:hypothetical protein ACFWPU_00880 [Streptomyces sp. NPDC058471]|uniref:hypothetical protein n=1 Tax=Streptomyces sp. NPDC058471 TaxID=3346516 RepID=UPI00364D9D24
MMQTDHWPDCSDRWLVTHNVTDPGGLFRVTCGCPERHPWIPSGGSWVEITVPKPPED